MSAYASTFAIDWSGPARQACPACATRPRDKALSVTFRPEGAVAHCFRCSGLWFERPSARRETSFDVEIERRRATAHAQEARRRADAAGHALLLWNKAVPVDAHPYLARKGIQAHGTRVDAAGRLLVPMHIDATLVNLQRIAADGAKRFLAGGRTKSACCVLRDLSLDVGAVFVAEGFATAATVHEATALPVVVAFSAGNLLAAAATARRLFPEDAVVIAADNDAGKERNAGLESARVAAAELRCFIVAPDDPGDWNDMRARYGWAPVVSELNEAANRAMRRRP